LLEAIKNPVTIEALASKFGVDSDRIKTALWTIAERGFNIFIAQDNLVHLKTVATHLAAPVVRKWEGEQIIRFGIVSDSHLGSYFQQLSFLRYAYERFAFEGISQVYHCGDIVDGSGMRRGHEYEVFCHGADGQARYVKEKYPFDPNIRTDFITGNHDLAFLTQAGHDIGKSIANLREDLRYLGPELAKIQLTPNCQLELWHGRDGSAYAKSYALQKYVEAMSGGDKPNILFAGHRHKQLYTFYRNVHSFEAGCLQAQTPFMRGKKLAADVGFWMVELGVNPVDGTIQRVKPEFFPQYVSVKDDY
jgi:predicted phosphodiesterase